MEQRADNGETPPFAIQPMKTSTIKYAVYCRNMPFWVTRQQRGEEIQLTRVGRFVGFLHAFPKCAGLKPLQPQEVSAAADRRFRASALPNVHPDLGALTTDGQSTFSNLELRRPR